MIWSENNYIPKFSKDENEIEMLRSMNPNERRESLIMSDTLSYKDKEIDKFEKAEGVKELHEAIHSLPDRECKIICLLYGIGESRSYRQKEVAERFGLSQSYISRLEKNILKKMKIKLKNYR